MAAIDNPEVLEKECHQFFFEMEDRRKPMKSRSLARLKKVFAHPSPQPLTLRNFDFRPHLSGQEGGSRGPGHGFQRPPQSDFLPEGGCSHYFLPLCNPKPAVTPV